MAANFKGFLTWQSAAFHSNDQVAITADPFISLRRLLQAQALALTIYGAVRLVCKSYGIDEHRLMFTGDATRELQQLTLN